MGKNNIFYDSPKIAVRSAMGNLGYGGTEYQTIESDMIRWTAEAQDLIIRNKVSLPMVEETILSLNNQIHNSRDFKILENININGVTVPYSNQSHSSPLVRMGSAPYRCGQHPHRITFAINRYAITFSPAIDDDTPVTVQFLCKPMDEEGWPMVIDICLRAISHYVGYMLCTRLKDPRAKEQYAVWLTACRQARAEVNTKSQEELMELGRAWTPMRQQYGYARNHGGTLNG